MEDYRIFLNNNEKIFNFIIDNDLEKILYQANMEAKNMADKEGQEFLHSYRFSKVYDIVMENNLDRENIFQILNLLENPFNKNIESFEYYKSIYDDGDIDIVSEYKSKYGNNDLINWYEGIMSTDSFIEIVNLEKEGKLNNEL